MNLRKRNIETKKTIGCSFLLLILLFFGSIFNGKAQEKILPLFRSNDATKMIQPAQKAFNQQFKSAKVRQLPFFDDFSTYLGYPSDSFWMDNYVYINTGFPVKPPSTGVATFDGLNNFGRAYNPGSNANSPADTLTSAYINLSGLKEKDSVYLSFFYQPQGLGENPDEGDSLLLEFKPDRLAIDTDATGKGIKWDSTRWVKIWAKPGGGVYPFKIALIPVRFVKNCNYFQNKFQFRFRNFANNSGNLDIWNIDYVYMNKGRTAKDSIFKDIAVYQPSISLIKYYNAIPWKHFINNTTYYYTDSIHLFTHNNDSFIKHVTFSYNISSLSDRTNLATAKAQVNNVNKKEFQDFKMGSIPFFNTYNPKNKDSVVIGIKTIAKGDVAENAYFRLNDTALHVQNFKNYFAYDDGTAETGYGITNSPNGAMVAVKFNMQQPDTLYGIGIHFNQANDDVSLDNFNLMVWNSINSNNTLAEKDIINKKISFLFPKYVRHTNGFYYFPLDTPKAIGNTFYLGWSQSTDFMLNVGFDMNYPSLANSNYSNLFYNVNGTWSKSKLHGIPMIRAYVGKKPEFSPFDTAVTALGINTNFTNLKTSWEIYPNPSNGSFTINLEETGNFDISILDLTGKTILDEKNKNGLVQLLLQNCPSGIYLVKIASKTTGAYSYKKIAVY